MEVIPEALPKFSRLTRRRKLIFGLAPGKLRFTAFQRCISWGGVRLVEMGQNSDCLKKSAQKTAILSDTNLDHLTLERASTHNFKDYDLFRVSFEKYWT